MTTVSLSKSTRYAIPQDIQGELPDPLTPWMISEGLFATLAEPSPGSLYKRAQIFPWILIALVS